MKSIHHAAPSEIFLDVTYALRTQGLIPFPPTLASTFDSHLCLTSAHYLGETNFHRGYLGFSRKVHDGVVDAVMAPVTASTAKCGGIVYHIVLDLMQGKRDWQSRFCITEK